MNILAAQISQSATITLSLCMHHDVQFNQFYWRLYEKPIHLYNNLKQSIAVITNKSNYIQL